MPKILTLKISNNNDNDHDDHDDSNNDGNNMKEGNFVFLMMHSAHYLWLYGKGSFYMYHPTDRIVYTPTNVEHWLIIITTTSSSSSSSSSSLSSLLLFCNYLTQDMTNWYMAINPVLH